MHLLQYAHRMIAEAASEYALLCGERIDAHLYDRRFSVLTPHQVSLHRFIGLHHELFEQEDAATVSLMGTSTHIERYGCGPSDRV
jgi:hypothetical protein